MTWLRYSGRIMLAVGVVGIALWATHQKLLYLPAREFWTGIICYLIAAEVVWTLAERRGPIMDERLLNQGLYRLGRRERERTGFSKWLCDGGRVRMADINAGHDAVRDAHQGMLSAVLTREAGPRLYLVSGAAGTGRSTMLLRLGRALAEQGQVVYLALPGSAPTGVQVVVEAARKAQVYLLMDDLDLRPQAEECLYEIFRAGLPVVVIGTCCSAGERDSEEDGLAALGPATFLSQAHLQRPQISANDLASLARKLGSLGCQRRAGLSAEGAVDFVSASRYLQAREPDQQLWSDLDHGPGLPDQQKIMVALCGIAELAVPLPLLTSLLGPRMLPRWQKAGLLAVEYRLALAPHRAVCADLLRSLSHDGRAARAALDELLRLALPAEPGFVLRLLFGLSQADLTAGLAREQVETLRQASPQAAWPPALQRLWQRVLDSVGLPGAVPEEGQDYPPEISLRAAAAFGRGDYQQALELSRRLVRNGVYQAPARFNVALALLRLGRVAEAEAELAELRPGPPGTHYLRGVIAEFKADYVAALDAFETSRKADELQLAATRRLAFCYVRSGAPRAAIPLFESALSYAPLRADLYGGLAVAHLHAGTAQRAAAQSARAIQAGVDPLVARKAVARACADAHAYDRAASELEACVSYDPSDVQAWRDLAIACRWLGRFEREEECLRRVQLADPDNQDLNYEMARCERDQGRAQDALRLLEPLLAAETPNVAALLLAAEAIGTCGDRERQRDLANRALAAGDSSGWAYYWLGESYGSAQAEALEAYRLAVGIFKTALAAGVPPRRAARLWQAVHLCALALGDEALALQANRRARQDASVCAALGVDIECIVHRRSVPTDVFLETLPPLTAPDEPEQPPTGRIDSRGTTAADATLLRGRPNLRARQ